MQNPNSYIFNAQPIASANSSALSSSQWVAASFLGAFSVTDAAGTLKIQFSNDPPLGVSPFTPTNWVDVPGTTATATVASGAACVIYVPTNFVARWYRLVWTRTGGTGTFSVTYNAIFP